MKNAVIIRKLPKGVNTMPTMPDLELILSELQTAANVINNVVDTMRNHFIQPDNPTASAEPVAEPVPEVTEPATITLEHVRAELSKLSRAGKTDKARELVLKYGANKLTEIDPSKYAAMLADAQVLTDGLS